MQGKKPVGVRFLAAVFLLYGMFFGFAIFRLYGMITVYKYPITDYILHLIIALVLCIGYVAGSLGLLKFKEWARKVFLGLLSINVIYSVQGGFQGAYQNVTMQVQQKGLEPIHPFIIFLMALPVITVFILFFGGCIYYLTRPKVKDAFR